MQLFKLQHDGVTTTIHPILSDDVGFEEAMTGQRYRETMDGKVQLVREEFDLIDAAAFTDKFNFYRLQDGVTVWEGFFYKADCDIDEDNKVVTFTPEPADGYADLEGGKNKEFDFLKFEPTAHQITYKKRAAIQFYILNSETIANFVDGAWFEKDVNQVISSGGTLTSDHNFVVNTTIISIPFIDGTTNAYWGEYEADGINYVRKSGTSYTIIPDNVSVGIFQWRLYKTTPLTLEVTMVGTMSGIDDITTVTFQYGDGRGFQVEGLTFYTRILTDETLAVSIGTPTAVDLDEDSPDWDIQPLTFTHSIPYALQDNGNLVTDSITQATTGGYGATALGTFYVRPSLSHHAIFRTQWTDTAAYWILMDSTLRGILNELDTTLTLNHAYKLEDCVRALLSEIDPLVDFGTTTGYSQLLYAATNPVTGLPNYDIYITPKTNILVGDYDIAASKGKIRLDDIFRALKALYKADYFLDSDRKLFFEAATYFRNGGDYNTEVIGYSLLNRYEPQLGKFWTYRTTKYDYLKQNIPEAIEFSFMDSQSRIFDGDPIKINGEFSTKGNIEKNVVGRFSTDITLMTVDPDSFSRDGFAMFLIDGRTMPFEEIEGVDCQNGQMSMTWLQPNFWIYNAPTDSININGLDVVPTTVDRIRKQVIKAPVIGKPDSQALVETTLGRGKIISAKRTLYDVVEYTLKHDI